jgi:hypothetical protein
MPATSTPVEDPLGGFAGDLSRSTVWETLFGGHYKGLREELDMTRHQKRRCEFIAPEWYARSPRIFRYD